MTAQEPDPLKQFALLLQDLQEKAGSPSLKRLAELAKARKQLLPPSTVSDKLNGKSVPSWEFVSSFVTACVDHAREAGRPIPHDMAGLPQWDANHEAMVDAVEARGTTARLAKAAQDEKARRAIRLGTPDGPANWGKPDPGDIPDARAVLSREASLYSPVSDVRDALRLGVHPALPPTGNTGDSDAKLPLYVPRDIDQDLDTVLDHGQLVLLVGDAAAGKSRTAYEALRRMPEGRWLFIPKDAGSLRRLADAGAEFRDTVVWLDNLEHYLDAPGLDVALLDRLAGDAGRKVVVLATIRTGEFNERGHEGGGPAGRDSLRTEQHLLESARVFRLERRVLTRGERERAAELAVRDSRIRAALLAESQGVGLAEFLAAAPRLWDRWHDGRASDVQPAGAAIVAAAIDCRRAGLLRPASEQLLRDLYRLYLDERAAAGAGADSFEAGLAWATTRVHATSALLTRRAGGYEVFGYLLDRVQLDPRSPAVPAATWTAVVRNLDPDDAGVVGIAAYYAGQGTAARAAFECAARSRLPAVTAMGLHGLGLILWNDGDQEQAEQCLRQVLGSQDLSRLVRATVSNSLGHLLRARGRLPEAEALLRQAVEVGWPPAVIALGRLLDERGERQEAEELFRHAAATGSAVGSDNLGWLLQQRGDLPGAESAYLQAAMHGSAEGASRLGVLLAARGEEAEAIKWWRVAATGGDLEAATDLGHLLATRDQFPEGRGWLLRAAGRGHARAAYILAKELIKRGQATDGERYLRQSAGSTDAGSFAAATDLATLLVKRGDLDDAEYWLRQVADAPEDEMTRHENAFQLKDNHRHGGLRQIARVNLAEIALRRGNMNEARQWCEQAAAAGSADAQSILAVIRQAEDDLESELSRLRKEAARGDAGAILELAAKLAANGELDEAEQYLQPLARKGNSQALVVTADIRATRGDADTAAKILREVTATATPETARDVAVIAIAHGMTPIAEQALSAHDPAQIAGSAYETGLALLHLAHQRDQAAWFLAKAAEAGHPGAQASLGKLLLENGQTWQARGWLRRAAEAGNTDAQYNLGHLLKHAGEPAEAEHWYTRAAGAGHPWAQNNLGILLDAQGRHEEAEHWLRLAADSGDQDAENNLRHVLRRLGRPVTVETGPGSPQRPETAQPGQTSNSCS